MIQVKMSNSNEKLSDNENKIINNKQQILKLYQEYKVYIEQISKLEEKYKNNQSNIETENIETNNSLALNHISESLNYTSDILKKINTIMKINSETNNDTTINTMKEIYNTISEEILHLMKKYNKNKFSMNESNNKLISSIITNITNIIINSISIIANNAIFSKDTTLEECLSYIVDIITKNINSTLILKSEQLLEFQKLLELEKTNISNEEQSLNIETDDLSALEHIYNTLKEIDQITNIDAKNDTILDIKNNTTINTIDTKNDTTIDTITNIYNSICIVILYLIKKYKKNTFFNYELVETIKYITKISQISLQLKNKLQTFTNIFLCIDQIHVILCKSKNTNQTRKELLDNQLSILLNHQNLITIIIDFINNLKLNEVIINETSINEISIDEISIDEIIKELNTQITQEIKDAKLLYKENISKEKENISKEELNKHKPLQD